MDYVKISNSSILWLLCGITVFISLLQAILYMRMAKKTAVRANIPDSIPKKAFRVGLISAIGPALGVFIVMSSIGGPLAWLRLSIIGAAPTELTAATLGAQACGVELGGAGFTLTVMAVSWFTMTLNGAGWLVSTGVITPALEKVRDKISGGDGKWLVVLSGACSLGIFGYLNVNEISKGAGGTAAVLGGIFSMMFLAKFLVPKFPKLREYTLGIAMIIGMACAIVCDLIIA